MKKRYFLPIGEPQFICYNHFTCSNAIVRANAGEEQQILMASKYINCFYKETSTKHKFIISMYDHWCTAQTFMQYQLINFLKETYKREKTNLILIIKKCLLNDCYILSQCNRAYVEPNVEENAPVLNFVIVGFDDITHEFTIYGLDVTGEKFLCFKVNYQEMIDALFDNKKPNISFTLWRCNKGVPVVLDLPNIIFELEDYIHSTNRRNHYTADKIYGLDAIERLRQLFWEDAQKGEPLSEAYLHKFAFHKHCMKDRIECLISHNVIDPQWLLYAEKNEQYGMDVMDLGQQINHNCDPGLVSELSSKISETITIERFYLPKVLDEIKNDYEKKKI